MTEVARALIGPVSLVVAPVLKSAILPVVLEEKVYRKLLAAGGVMVGAMATGVTVTDVFPVVWQPVELLVTNTE